MRGPPRSAPARTPCGASRTRCRRRSAAARPRGPASPRPARRRPVRRPSASSTGRSRTTDGPLCFGAPASRRLAAASPPASHLVGSAASRRSTAPAFRRRPAAEPRCCPASLGAGSSRRATLPAGSLPPARRPGRPSSARAACASSPLARAGPSDQARGVAPPARLGGRCAVGAASGGAGRRPDHEAGCIRHRTGLRPTTKDPRERGPRQYEIRRRPTLPGSLPPSTIGAGGLNFRVRNGNGCDPAAMATEICCQTGAPSWRSALEDSIASTNIIVDPSPRPISTGRLNTLPCVHLRPINVVVYHGPYLVNPVGNLILERASHLDAFSAYPFRRSLTSRALGRTTGTRELRPSRSSRTRDSLPQVSYGCSG